MGLDLTPFYLGLALICSLFFNNSIFAVFAKLYKIRLERFDLFLTYYNRYLLNFTRKNVVYRLGYLPLGSSIKVAGMTKDELDPENPVVENDMFIAKPFSSQIAVRVLPLIATAVVIALCVFFIHPDNTFLENIQIAKTAVVNIYNYLLENIDTDTAIATWNSITEGNNEFFIMIIILLLLDIFFAIVMPVVYFLIQNPQTYHVVIIVILQVLVYGFILYKFGALFINLHTFSEGMITLLMFFGTTSILAYVLFLGIKYFPENRYF